MAKRKYLMETIMDVDRGIKFFKRIGGTNIKVLRGKNTPSYINDNQIFFILDDRNIPQFNSWLKRNDFEYTAEEYRITQTELKRYKIR